MRTSTPGRPRRDGFTLVELAAVLFVLGLILWIAVRAWRSWGNPGGTPYSVNWRRHPRRRTTPPSSKKRETRLILRPDAGTFEFRRADRADDPSRPRELGPRLSITGIRVEGEDRLLDIRPRSGTGPAGSSPSSHLPERRGRGGPSFLWTLRLEPYDGSLKILEGTVRDDG